MNQPVHFLTKEQDYLSDSCCNRQSVTQNSLVSKLEADLLLPWCLNIISWCSLASKIHSCWIRSLFALKIVDYLDAGINLTCFSSLKQDRGKSIPPSQEDMKHRSGGHAFSKTFL